jgi:ribonucleoside-diphosphate reductase beta chain
MMLTAFEHTETIHVVAYSYLLDTIGMPEIEYSTFLQYKEMKDKYDYMHSFKVTDVRSLLITIAAFAAFTEGLQLFASFVILMNFPRFNKLKGMGQIISWSVRDETCHLHGMMRVFHEIAKFHPEAWDEDAKQKVYEICENVLVHEDAFIDLAFEMGDIEGLKSEDVKKYMRFIADRRLKQLGLKKKYNLRKNPMPWVDEALALNEHQNFFEGRATEYSKAATIGSWDEAFMIHLQKS